VLITYRIIRSPNRKVKGRSKEFKTPKIIKTPKSTKTIVQRLQNIKVLVVEMF